MRNAFYPINTIIVLLGITDCNMKLIQSFETALKHVAALSIRALVQYFCIKLLKIYEEFGRFSLDNIL